MGLAHLGKVAFLAASRHSRRPVVKARCDRIDFAAPARIGETVEPVGRVVRAGRCSLGVEVELHAEALLTGGRRLRTRGLFDLVTLPESEDVVPLSPLVEDEEANDGWLRTVEMVFPGATNSIDFSSPIAVGDMIELASRVKMVVRSSLGVEVQLWSENLLMSERRHSATAESVMVAVDGDGRPKTFTS